MQRLDQVQATTAGNLALQVLKSAEHGRVCGVFSSALAVEFGRVAVTLSADNRGWPLGIGIPSLPPTMSRNWIDLAVEYSPATLDIVHARWRVDLQSAVVWDGWHALTNLAPSSSDIRRGSDQARAWRSRHTPGPTVSDPALPTAPPSLPPDRLAGAAFERHIGAALEQVLEGLRRQDQSVWSSGAEALLGVGPGLTPAGDDVLTGLLLALQSVRDAPLAALPELLTLIRERAPSRTTLYGASALHAACLGQAPEVVVGALAALFHNPGAVAQGLEALTAIGATSGFDTLQGLSAGLDLMSLPSSHGQRPRSPRT
jgi:hypothetical protein